MRARGIPVLRPVKKAATRYSLVVPFFNVGRYVDDFFYSIFSQSIDTDGLEIVAVDDGSTDDTATRIEAWSNRFPGRIKYILQENQGQAVARNTGLVHATGEWIGFPDPDDFFSFNYLEEVDAEIARDSHLSMVSCNMIFYRENTGRLSNRHPLRFRYSKHRTTLPAADLQDYIQLSVAQAWFRRSLIEQHNLRFDPRVVPTFEDGHFVNRFLLLNPRSTVTFIREPVYYYRKRDDGSSTLDGANLNKNQYLDVLRYGALDLLHCAREKAGGVPQFIQRTILYHLVWRFRYLVDQRDRSVLSASQELEFFALLPLLFDGIDRSTINSFELARCTEEHKVALLSWFKSAKRPVTAVYARSYDAAKALLQLSYFSLDPALDAVAHVSERLTPLRHVSRRRASLLDRTYFYEHFFWVAAPRDASVTVRVEGDLGSLKVRGAHFGANPSVQQLEGALRPSVNTRNLPEAAIALRKLATANEARERYGRCWLCIDRIDKADDNAEHFYRYLISIGKAGNAFFVLHQDSADWKRLEEEGFQLIPFGTDEHKTAHINAEFLISSHMDDAILWPAPKDEIRDVARYRFILLKHGVLKHDASKWFNAKNIARVVTATKDEYASFVRRDSEYKLSDKEVSLTGFCRHDRLGMLERARATILIMPTWRKYLSGPPDAKSRRTRDEKFLMSRYFSAWRALLHSKRLKAISVERDLHIVFAPHLNVTQHLCDFDLPDWIQVPVGRSIQDLFSQAAVLVTDYSSVDAEVAYLEKPIVYYQFDSDETLSGAHVYKRGDFDYEQQGYGPVCQTEVHLLRELEAAVCGNRARKYVDRSRDAFRYRDGHCCKRAYQSILELDKPLPESRIVLKSYTQVPNAGDAANAAIISRLTDARVEISDGKSLSQPNLIALGSLLQWIDPRSVIWGTGVLSDEYPIATLPERVFAVRGPLTRKKLLDAGADCPELFGDPGILISDIYPRRTGSMSGLGIIPHYVDRDEPYIAEALRYGARLIDVGQPLEDYLEALCKCDCVLTSSLHGVIFAHSYGIPAAWVQLSGKVVGGSLKFRDYYASVGFNQADIPNLSGSDRVDYAVQSATLPREEIDRRQLLRALAEAQQYLFDMQQSTIIATA